jgi:hypothetical protein
MGTLLKIVGGSWAIIGIANIALMPWANAGETLLGFGFIFNGLLFILPGLVVYGIGDLIQRRKRAQSAQPEELPPATRKTSPIAWGVLILLILGFVSYLVNQPSTTSSSSSSRTSSSSTTDTSKWRTSPEMSSYSPPLEVLSWRCEKEYGYVYVVGEVKNVSGRKLENVMAVGEFRTKDGSLVKSEDALLDYNPILPGQTSPFKAGGTDNPSITKCNLSFKHLFGSQISYTIAESKKKKLQEDIMEAQRLLSELGYNPGAADGIAGPKTTEAVKAFQRDHGLAEDGEVTDGLLEQLRRARQ